MKTEIPVMFCFDNNYVIPAGVAFYSLLENANKNYFYRFYVLHSDITEINQNKLRETIEPFSSFSSLEFIDMTHRFEDLWQKIKTKGHFSKEVMYKVLVASIFPQYDKIIVSDVDVVFLNDISDSFTSFNINDDYYLAGVKAVGKIMHYMDNYKKSFTDEEIVKLSGFCGGYIVFNLKKLREDNMEEKFIECFEKEGHRINQMEQDVLNLCCYPKTAKLHLKYVACSYMWDLYKTDDDFDNDQNYSRKELEEAMNETVQLHYATSTKPWKKVDSTKSEEWFKYIVKTPFLVDYLNYLPKNIVLPINEESNINEKKPRLKIYYHKVKYYVRHNPFFLVKPSFYKKLAKKSIKVIKRKLFNQTSLLIIDDSFPSDVSPFRYEEFLTYLKKFPQSKVLVNFERYETDEERKRVSESIDKFVKEYPKYADRFEYSSSPRAKMAICVFLNNIYSQIDFLEKNKIPFIFTLYPGGGFSLNNDESDEKLKRVFSSNYFEKVIVTQPITYNYLVENNFCTEDKIEFIYGGIITKKIFDNKVLPKKKYKCDKKTFDICFVAHKYMEKGTDKGYDKFIDVAKELSKKHKDMRFHVVGEFTENDIDVKKIRDKINFYGVHETSWFPSFYTDKDIILSPNVPFILSNGSFDGFPTSCCIEAMLNKVALFCTDRLKLNMLFEDKKDLIIIDHNTDDIVKKIEYYYKHIDELELIADNGYNAVKRNYCFKKQLLPRIRMIKKAIKKKKRECKNNG